MPFNRKKRESTEIRFVHCMLCHCVLNDDKDLICFNCEEENGSMLDLFVSQLKAKANADGGKREQTIYSGRDKILYRVAGQFYQRSLTRENAKLRGYDAWR